MDRRLANRLFLLGWPLIVVAAGIIGFRGFDAIGVAALLLAAVVAIPASVATIRYDCADRQHEKAIGNSHAHRAVMEKGRTAAWIMMISCSLFALLVWYLLHYYDVRAFLWQVGRVYVAITVLGCVIAMIGWLIERHNRKAKP